MADLHTQFIKMRYLFRVLSSGGAADRPFHCHYQVTRRCNFRCESCRVWCDDLKHNELTPEEIELLAAKLVHIGVLSVSVTGGEPLVRPDSVQIVRVLKKSGLIVRLQTNGYLLGEKTLDDLINSGVDDIHISLDTLDPSRFRRINGVDNPAVFDTVLSNIRRAARALNASGKALFLTAVMRALNIDEIDALYALADELGCFIGYYGLEVSGAHDPFNIRAHDPHLLPDERDRARLAEGFRKVKDLRKRPHSAVFMSARLIDDYIRFYSSDTPSMKWPCHAGDRYLEIAPDGAVGICNAAPTLDGYSYKNIEALYASSDRKTLFEAQRMHCNGCICTRQLDYIIDDKWDSIGKAFQYSFRVLLRRKGR